MVEPGLTGDRPAGRPAQAAGQGRPRSRARRSGAACRRSGYGPVGAPAEPAGAAARRPRWPAVGRRCSGRHAGPGRARTRRARRRSGVGRGPGGEAGDAVGAGGHVGQVGLPRRSTIGQCFGGAVDREQAVPEPAWPGQHGAGGVLGVLVLFVPTLEQPVAQLLGVAVDGGRAAVGLGARLLGRRPAPARGAGRERRGPGPAARAAR